MPGIEGTNYFMVPPVQGLETVTSYGNLFNLVSGVSYSHLAQPVCLLQGMNGFVC